MRWDGIAESDADCQENGRGDGGAFLKPADVDSGRDWEGD